MPDWLVKVLMTLAIQLGIPLAKTLLKWVPQAFWDAVEEMLKHLTFTVDDPEPVAEEFKKRTRECIGPICPTDVVEKV